jgi:PKD repeat protein
MTRLFSTLVGLLLCSAVFAQTQPDFFTTALGTGSIGNVLSNDTYSGGFAQLVDPHPCFAMLDNGELVWSSTTVQPTCCGTHVFEYALCTSSGNCVYEVATVNVSCGPPPCGTLALLEGGANGAGGAPDEGGHCASVCAFDTTLVNLPYIPGNTYTWTVTGGTWSVGANPAEIEVVWGPAGGGFVSVTVLTAGGMTRTYDTCVDILPGPTASFTSTAYACLGAGMSFTNTSVGATGYFWDFGDGNTSGLADPTHTYAAPGTYVVTLTAFKDNFDAAGNPLCTCEDTFTMVVEVDDLPGPNIFCISTLCEGDSATYWTDATGCDSLVWTVLDAQGLPLPFTQLAPDSIAVVWPTGPFGTLTLAAFGCDQTYCTSPTSVTVPIISSTAPVLGPDPVCEFSTAVYEVPKWAATAYLWTVTGGTIVGSDSSHTVTVAWGAAGTGTLHVDWISSFLQGLPGHTPPDCSGAADLTVTILPDFDVLHLGPSTVCVGTTTSFTTTSTLAPFMWTVNPSLPVTPTGPYTADLTWTTPGVYQVTATAVGLNTYCSSSHTVTVQVVGVPTPGPITGATSVCIGAATTYSATAAPGTYLMWSATGGTPTQYTGPTTSVVWTGPTPLSVSIVQGMTGNPGCMSDPVTLSVTPLTLPVQVGIIGTGTCTNSTESYSLSPAPPAGTTVTWSISPAAAGSVVAGAGTDSIDVQWNALGGPVTLTAVLELCGTTSTVQQTLNLIPAVVPVIQQTGILCPGVQATLSAPGPFMSWTWTGNVQAPSLVISGSGTFVVTTVDGNGCEATSGFTASNVPGPVAAISSGNPLTFCVGSPSPVTLVAQTNPGYSFSWFCNGNPLALPPSTSSISHAVQGIPSTTSYYTVVQDANGCTATSNSLLVHEIDCSGSGPSCNPEPFTIGAYANVQNPNCNTVDFGWTGANVTAGQWNFGDGNTGSGNGISHIYTSAGCYQVVFTGLVPEAGGTGDYCAVSETLSVCVPLAAYFDIIPVGCSTVQLTDMSTYLNLGPNSTISSWSWNVGFGPVLTGPNQTVAFPGPGTYTITLTVTNGNGCTATYSETITVGGVGIPAITASAGPYCAGDPISFSANALNAIQYTWNFGDGATFLGATPQHAYLNPGTYPVSVTAADANGCTQTSTLNIAVQPGIPDFSLAPIGPLTVCANGVATVCAPIGFASYDWNPSSETGSCAALPAGTYTVTVTDANGCTSTSDAVLIESITPPSGTIGGPQFICGSGCINLIVPYVPGYTYQWIGNSTGALAGETNTSLTVCAGTLDPAGYSVKVVDAYGCSAVLGPHVVHVATPPSFAVSVAPTSCANGPTTLSVTPADPNVAYTWSNGMTGPVITVGLAGTYLVTGVDLTSGCSASSSATVHPLPDFCAVATGCYTACAHDTICGPPGLAAYQWLLAGVPIPGANAACYEPAVSGEYALVATNAFGCTDTTEVIDVELIECPEGGCEVEIAVGPHPEAPDSDCCFALSYTAGPTPVYGVGISCAEASLVWQPGGLDPALTAQLVMPNSLVFTASNPQQPLPAALTDFISICLSNATASPQQVIVHWYDSAYAIFCADTLVFECPVEPDCLYATDLDVVCIDEQAVVSFTVCNPGDAPYPVGFLTINPFSPAGVVVSPPSFDLTGSPLAPGQCATFSAVVSGPGSAGQDFCFSLTAHAENPESFPGTLCCTLDTLLCIPLPQCNPCEAIDVTGYTEQADSGCCYSIGLVNGFTGGTFDGIALQSLSPFTSFSVNNPLNSGWWTSGYTGTAVTFLPAAGSVPRGVFSLPEICVTTQLSPSQSIEVLWLANGQIVCRDTIEVHCTPDCGYAVEPHIECAPATGMWAWSGMLVNDAAYPVSEAVIVFADPALQMYNVTVPIGPIPSGGLWGPLTIPIGAPAAPGDTVCFSITQHELLPGGGYAECCSYTVCTVLPDCGESGECLCSPAFHLAVAQGITATPDPNNPYVFNFSLTGGYALGTCDVVKWSFGDGTSFVATGNVSVPHTFLTTGNYTVCAKVVRTDVNGEKCVATVCMPIQIVLNGLVSGMVVFPNPSSGVFGLAAAVAPVGESWEITALDAMTRPVRTWTLSATAAGQILSIDLSDLPTGTYTILATDGFTILTEKAVKY